MSFHLVSERHKDGIYLEIREVKPIGWIVLPDDQAKEAAKRINKLLKTKFKNAKRPK